MDNKKTIRNIAIYLGIPILLFIIIFMLLNNRQVQTMYKYSDIVNYFAQKQVSEYQLDLGTGEMLMKVTEEGKDEAKVISYVVPSVTKFYDDVQEYINAYNDNHETRMVEDVRRPAETSWFVSLLPTILLFGGLIFFWWFMYRRMSATMGDAGKQMNFGKAKIKNMNDEKRKTTFADVAGADEEKEELQEIVEFLKNPRSITNWVPGFPKAFCWWALRYR